jgi:hypothetical protein
MGEVAALLSDQADPRPPPEDEPAPEYGSTLYGWTG